jgi:hypothetical protein
MSNKMDWEPLEAVLWRYLPLKVFARSLFIPAWHPEME